MNYILYILSASVCLGIFYAVFAILFRKGLSFNHARIFLIASVILSLMIPLTRYKIDMGIKWPDAKSKALIIVNETAVYDDAQVVTSDNNFRNLIRNADQIQILLFIYLSVSVILILRLTLTILILTLRFRKSFKVHLHDCILLYNHGFGSTLSFFRWIFVQPGNSDNDDISRIIAHEKIHVNQLHSLDVLILELLTAVMWFNPFVWMLRNSMKLVHEYLADEGALKSGINISRYQALLINQIAEERLVVLSSSFNHLLIKKRIQMMTKTKNAGKSPLRLLSILPVAIFLFLLMAAFNGVFSNDVNASETNKYSVNKVSDVFSASPNVPPDTIIKKTIIKKIDKNNPTDTVVIEKEEIITGDDISIVRHSGTREHGDVREHIIVTDEGDQIRHAGDRRHHEVRVHIDTADVIEHGDIIIRERGMKGDSIKHVKVIKKGGNDVIDEDKKVIIIDSHDQKSDILYIVDGEKMTDRKAIEILNADDIQSIQVLKGDDAMKYGKDYSGVMIITTKKAKK